jgi:uncharacterized protein (DUF1778 family)
MSMLAPINIRFEPDQRAALERAASEERRKLSELVRLVVLDWLADREKQTERRAA